MSSPGQIFLSYRSLERPFATRLAADLKNSGFALWMDVLDIKAGENWDRSLANAIDACAGIIAVLSPAYVKSEVCLDELARAHKAGRPIFPVLLESLMSDADWPLLIQRTQYLDFSDWRNPASYHDQLDHLLRELHQRFAGQVGELPDPETRYLNSLIADLEANRGVLQYVSLDALAEERPASSTRDEDEQAFDVLLDVKPGAGEQRTTRLYDLDSLLREQRLLVLLGDAGSGKTTTLRWLARRTALARRAEPKTQLLPVLLSLSQWRDDISFEEFLRSACPLLRGVALTLAAGDLLLLLDGLNEMGSAGPAKARALRSWIDELPSQPHTVITCRKREFGRFELGDVAIATLRELEEGHIRQFASKYLLSRTADFLDQVLPEPGRLRDARIAIGDLARNPYLLSAFIYLYQGSSDEALPTNTGALFSKLAKALWIREERRTRSSGQPNLENWETAKPALAGLARRMIESDESDDVRVEIALENLGGLRVFQTAVEASLLEQNGEFARFYHDLLRSYFAAESLREAGVETIDAWSRDHVSHWESVAVAWSGISANADAYLKYLNWQDAAVVVGRGYAASEDAVRECAGRAIQELQVDHWRSFQPAMDALTEMGKPVVLLLIEKLASDNAGLRERVVFVLGRIPDSRAVDSLVALLDDPSPDVQKRVVSALRTIGGDRALSALTEHLGDASSSSPDAAKAKDALATPASVESLLPLLEDPEKRVRIAAILSLVKLGERRATGPIVDRLGDADEDVRVTAIEALGLLGGEEAGASIARALHDPAEKVRLMSVASLRALGGPNASAPLVEALLDESGKVRELAATALVKLGDEQAVKPLVRVLDDEVIGVRQQAARALGRIGGRDAQKVLLERLRSDEFELWTDCADALDAQGWMPTEPSDRVRWFSARDQWSGCLALGNEAIPELRKVLEVADDPRRRGAAATLHKLGWHPSEPGPELFRYYVARVDWERQDRMYPFELINLLAWLEPLPRGASPVRKVVAEMLGELGVPLCGTELDRAIQGSDRRVQYFATVAAGVARCEKSFPAIIGNLNAPRDDSPVFDQGVIRIVSAQALGEGGGAVLDLLNHATLDIPSGIATCEDASTVAAIQAASRNSGDPEFFARIPATALGRSTKDLETYQIDLWSLFAIDESLLEKFTVSALLRGIAAVDRSKYSPFYSDMAFWYLHQRLTVLTLLCLTDVEEDETGLLAAKALAQIWGLTAEPVLLEAPQWAANEKIVNFARAELERRRSEQSS